MNTKKRVGILTYHQADNLGAVLQAYALQRALEERFSVDVEIIDYFCPMLAEKNPGSSGWKVYAKKCYYAWKHLGFARFRKKYLKLSEGYIRDNITDCVNRYDAFITGSDQVWNYECSGWDNTYFLDFVPNTKKKYSYAASMGKYRFTPEEWVYVRSALADFSGISVRETSAEQELSRQEIQGTVVCADPVMLLAKEQWLQIMPPRLSRNRYVFVYLIMDSESVVHHAQAYAQKHGYKVVCNKFSPEFILQGSPTDFLSWIYYAECVFTNSFHGTAFSLLFGKPLKADLNAPGGVVNERIFNILEKSGALHCAMHSSDEEAQLPNAEGNLNAMREESYRYLKAIKEDLC